MHVWTALNIKAKQMHLFIPIMAGNLWVVSEDVFWFFGSCRVMEFLAQQFYFRESVQFAHGKTVLLLNPRGTRFQQSQQLCRSAQRRDCSKEWALRKRHSILLQHGHLLTIFHVLFSLLNTKGLLIMLNIPLQKYTWISHLHLLIKLLSLLKSTGLGTRTSFCLFTKTHTEHRGFPSLFMWILHEALLPSYFQSLKVY